MPQTAEYLEHPVSLPDPSGGTGGAGRGRRRAAGGLPVFAAAAPEEAGQDPGASAAEEAQAQAHGGVAIWAPEVRLSNGLPAGSECRAE